MTTLSRRLNDYLAVRRSLGYDLSFSGDRYESGAAVPATSDDSPLLLP